MRYKTDEYIVSKPTKKAGNIKKKGGTTGKQIYTTLELKLHININIIHINTFS